MLYDIGLCNEDTSDESEISSLIANIIGTCLDGTVMRVKRLDEEKEGSFR